MVSRFLTQRFEFREFRRVHVPSERFADVHVERRGWRRPLRFRVANTEAARTVVAALRLDASRAKDRFRLAWKHFNSPWWVGVLSGSE